MPRPSRKADVLAAATACFAELGYDNTRVRHIAERSGMSEASIYRHFASLDDLATQVYSANLAAYARLVADAIESTRAERAVHSERPERSESSESSESSEIGDATVSGASAASDNAEERALRAIVQETIARYRSDRVSFVATLVRVPTFLPKLPAGTVYPLELIEAVIRQAQASGVAREGQPNLLAALFMGALLRPFLLAELAAPGAFDLLSERKHDLVIEEAALATVIVPR
ncbi:TetR/AcrR family transcriptional regulator [Subtercola endophyticus]|uniref:TetR/AcrR family transcriptional regulator n=1 Tax=Subtercola endophyticus TaxID=2895559 RepID=UPI001E592A11|nr:TetR/AcrR family transcriptional regulator [Subtercola endophyticus]UFS57465.1 TetR/AcrR family transcriptional regulator [Subtercola endophyticus]